MTFKLKGGPRRKRAALTLGGRLVQCGPFACIAGQIEPVNQNEYALKHEAPRHEATQAGLRGGGTETECSHDFLHAVLSRQYGRPRLTSRETHWASREAVPYWGWAKTRQEGPFTYGKSANMVILPPRHPRGFSTNPRPSTQSLPAPLKAPPFSSPSPEKSRFPAPPLLLC